MADTNASLDFSIVYVNNPKALLNQKPHGWNGVSEKPEECYVSPQGHGAFRNLVGVHKILGKIQVVSKMLAGKGNSPVEALGEDVRENSYASKIAGIAARIDGQIEEEAARIGKRYEPLGWSYERNGSDGEYVSIFSDIGVTDERVSGHDFAFSYGVEGFEWELSFKKSEVSSDEKADEVWGVQSFGGLMDVAGGRNHFRPVHWLFGEEVEVREEKRVFVSRPVLPLPAPIRAFKASKVSIFKIESYDEEFVPQGKLLRYPVFVPVSEVLSKLSQSGAGLHKNVKRAVKVDGQIEMLMSLLSSEPQFAGEIAKKAGMEPKQVSKLLKRALSIGLKIQISKKKDAARRMVPVFSL